MRNSIADLKAQLLVWWMKLNFSHSLL